jgi:Omp85 superfamily domain
MRIPDAPALAGASFLRALRTHALRARRESIGKGRRLRYGAATKGECVRRIVFAVALVLLVATAIPIRAGASAHAASPPSPEAAPQGAPPPDPAVRVTAPRSHTVRRVVLFPLELPGYALRAAIWPLSELLGWMQRDRVMERIDDTLSFKSERLWVYPIIEKSAGTSFGGGVGLKGYDLAGPGYHGEAEYRVHVNMDMFTDLSFGRKDAFHVGATPVSFDVDPSWAWQHGYDFYGVGAASQQSDKAEWDEQDLDGAAKLAFKPLKDTSFFVLLGGSATQTSNATSDGVNPLGDPPPGYGRWLPYVRVGAGVAHDTRDSIEMPHRGGIQSLEISRYQHVGDGNFSYNDFRLLVLHHIPLWSPEHVLSLRNAWWVQQTIGGDVVPVPRMAALDAEHMLRGFSRGRFRDSGSVVFSGDFRFPLSRSIGGILFADAGRVFPGFGGFAFDDFKFDGGGGVEFRIARVMVFRFRAAYGGEGVKLFFSLLKI